MNKLKLLTILTLFILLPTKTYAICSDEELLHFREIENDYKITYEYDTSNKDYAVTFHSPEPDNYDFVIYSDENYFRDCSIINDYDVKCNHVVTGKYDITIEGMTDSCDDILKNINLNIVRGNNFANDPLCKGIEEFVLCQPNYDKEMDYDTFVSRVEVYKKTKQKEAEKAAQEEQNNQEKPIDKVIDFIKDNLLKIILGVVFAIAIVVTIIITAKSIRKSRRLE